MNDRFERALAALSPKDQLVVGVSGGLDSMALLELLHSTGRRPIVAHFNHQLRGAESDGDEAFVREEAAKRDLRFVPGRGDVRAEAKGISIEMAARKLRHSFLAEVARGHSADIVLGHHADDQIELFVMRSMRNVNGYGSAGMRAHSVSPADLTIRILRPLLGMRKRELLEFVKANKIPFREDSSNALLDAERNRVRHEELPLLRGANGSKFDARILEAMEICRRQEDEARELAREWTSGDFSGLKERCQQDIIAVQLERAGVPVTAGRITTLLNNIAKTVMIRPGVLATLNGDGVMKIHKRLALEDPISIDLRSNLNHSVVYSGGTLEWDFPWPPHELKRSDGWMIFDGLKVGRSVVLRHPRPGDRVRLSGRSSARPLMDVFSRNKIPREQRERTVIATTESGEIFWVEGLRITEDFQAIEPTHDAHDEWSPSLLAWRWRRQV